MFSDAFSRDHQLIQADPKHSLYLACALLVRGNVQVSDLRRNIERFVIPEYYNTQSRHGICTETDGSCPEHSDFSFEQFQYQIRLLLTPFLNCRREENIIILCNE